MNNKKLQASSSHPNKINQEIRASQVRLINQEGEQVGIVALSQALEAARQAGLDLVEINPQGDPPICRLMDYGKHLYERHKLTKQLKKKQKKLQTKEIKLRPVTDKGAYELKLKQAIQFLQSGDKVKVTVVFRGREIMHQEIGKALLEKMKEDCLGVGAPETFPNAAEGRQLVMLLAPSKKKSGTDPQK